MNTQETTTGNRLIAEFMGMACKNVSGVNYPKGKAEWEIRIPGVLVVTKYGNLEEIFNSLPIKYHSSWDWLMFVVEKIEAIENSDNYEVDIFGNCCQIGTMDEHSATGKTKIEATWKAVIAFINWYNQNKTT